jgi:hypothetical protein
LEAIRWAFSQPLEKSSHKFVLVAMADCVRADGGDMLCWPSYKYLTLRTSLNLKTVEAAVYCLREDGYIVDTGMKKGETGKVVVYRLNAPKTGVVSTANNGPEDASGATGNTTENGGIGFEANPPVFSGNPPQNGEQSPQKVRSIPPKTGGRTSKNLEGTGKEPGIDAACAALPEVPRKLVEDWLKVRKDKRAGPVTGTVADGLRREARKANLSDAEAVRYCCEAGWQNFNSGFHAKREGLNSAPSRPAPVNKHSAAAAGIFGRPNQGEVIDV